MIHAYPNFINDAQRNNIRSRVYELKKYYRNVVELPDNNDYDHVCACALGNAIYAHNELDLQLNEIMKQNFSQLYSLTIEHIRNIFNIKNVSFSNFSVPGFHIFRGKSLNDKTKNLPYHKDISIFHHPQIDSSDIEKDFLYSFTSLIENTYDPCFLDYKTDKHYYQYGDFSIWDANLLHRIGASKFGENDSRITYQGHLFKIKNKDQYYLYF